ncbi:adenosylcobinamide amidohydrolase [Veillonella intestinalis]|uniref:adenosylcobinamide amidohydrolase n=1 Tax=Veillonella intestinalis TaxID=2941341 RepID=UPI00203FC222|nr:adenosylcobinamide amidohydrolase [Veillonella intestinalis]
MTKHPVNNPYQVPAHLAVGGQVTVNNTSIVVAFDEVRYSLSTGPLNGGLHHIMAIRNQNLPFFVNTEKELPGGSAAGYLSAEFEQEDYPLNFCTGLITSATMEFHVYAQVTAGDVIVETIATAGFEATAHCAGDGFYYEEKDGEFHQPGTINLLVFTNKALTDGALTKALITITEAKSAAFRDAEIKSLISGAYATGTATDGVILTIDTNGDVLTDSGTYSLFGDTLAKCVRLAMARAFENIERKAEHERALINQ